MPIDAEIDTDHRAAVAGRFYLEVLAELHSRLQPRTYLEIGTASGESLAMSEARSIAVDPNFQLRGSWLGKKRSCWLFQQPSDDFFARHDPAALFAAPVDLAFLDGMHLAEFLLRDFINTERSCHPRSIVVLHDCLPPGYYMTSRDQGDPQRQRSICPKDWWTGDVWKLIPVLRALRPDLSLKVIDSQPTGLVLITNLDPESRVLPAAMADIVERRFPALDGRPAYDEYWRGVEITRTAALMPLLVKQYGEFR